MSNRDTVVGFRVSDAERQVLNLMLEQEDRRVSEFIRELVRAEAAKRGLWPVPANVQAQTQAQTLN